MLVQPRCLLFVDAKKCMKLHLKFDGQCDARRDLLFNFFAEGAFNSICFFLQMKFRLQLENAAERITSLASTGSVDVVSNATCMVVVAMMSRLVPEIVYYLQQQLLKTFRNARMTTEIAQTANDNYMGEAK